jgi:hypothetical protein
MLHFNPKERISVDLALNHPFLLNDCNKAVQYRNLHYEIFSKEPFWLEPSKSKRCMVEPSEELIPKPTLSSDNVKEQFQDKPTVPSPLKDSSYGSIISVQSPSPSKEYIQTIPTPQTQQNSSFMMDIQETLELIPLLNPKIWQRNSMRKRRKSGLGCATELF